MRMEEFAQLVLNETTRLLAEKNMDCTATLTSVIKSNDLVKSGICIRRKDSGMGPNLYLDKIYPRFEAGEPISDLVEELIDVFIQSEHDAQPDAEDFDLSFDKIKDSLRVRVVDTQANRKYLQTVVHLEVPGTGLAYVPEMRMDKDGGFWSAVITKAMADANGYDHNDVMILAVNNTVKCDPPKLMYLSSAIFNYEDKDSNLLGKDEPINSEPLVLTSESTEFGAYAMLQKPVLDFIAEKVGPFHVLPSSRHEAIIIPCSMDSDENNLRMMVREANRSVVSPDDFLSDDIYVYSEAEGLRRCPEKILKEKTQHAFVAERNY